MIKNIIIIGAGWYGCYAALLLQDLYCVTLIDKENDIFNKSSYYNQNRLHLGYHYPRNYKTRSLCKNGYDKFINKFYKYNIIENINKNYYLISNDSNIDFETYNSIYKYENYEFNLIKNITFKSINENIINVKECVINSEKAKQYFIENIRCCKIFNKKVLQIYNNNNKLNLYLDDTSIINCDLIIDCTYNSLNLSSNKYLYEKTLSLVYKKINNTDFDAITMVDGKFFSLYPHNISNNIYTLTDVEYTPLIVSNNIDDINEFKINEDFVNIKKEKITNKVKYYYESFDDNFEYVGYFISNKTKLISNSDSRECNIENVSDNIITINCGKITGIFEMEDYFKKIKLI